MGTSSKKPESRTRYTDIYSPLVQERLKALRKKIDSALMDGHSHEAPPSRVVVPSKKPDR